MMLEVALAMEQESFKTRINVIKLSKANATFWMLLSAIVIYIFVKWGQIPLPSIAAEEYQPKHATADYFVCSTNNSGVMYMTKGHASVFPAKVSEDFYVFITSNQNAVRLIQTKHVFTPCETYYNNFIYKCCQYSPNTSKFGKIKTYNGFYHYDFVVEEAPFQIEDIVFGSSRRITQHVTITTKDFRISTEHRSCEAVAIDPYPEIHIDVHLYGQNGTSSHKFHWYL